MKLAYAYQATLAPALAAFYFNGNELLGRLTDPTPALAQKIAEHRDRLRARGKETVNLVLLGEARAIQAGMRDAEVPPRPQTMAQFQAWSKSTTTFVESVTRADQREHAVFLLGFVLGDLLLSLALRALTEDLLAAAPGHPLLTAQRASLLAAEEKRVGELRLCAENPGIPASARGCVAAMATSASDEDRRVAQPEALLAVLNGARAEMQRYLEE